MAQGASIEARVYGSSAASLSRASLMTAVAASAFPSAGINVDVHFHSEGRGGGRRGGGRRGGRSHVNVLVGGVDWLAV